MAEREAVSSLGADLLKVLTVADNVWDLTEDAAIARLSWLFFQFLYAFAVPGKGQWGSSADTPAATTNIISTGDTPHVLVHVAIGDALADYDGTVFPSSAVSVKIAVEHLTQVRKHGLCDICNSPTADPFDRPPPPPPRV